MVIRRDRLSKSLYRIGASIISLVELFVIGVIAVMIGFTVFFIAFKLRSFVELVPEGSTTELQLLVNDVFLLIIFGEIIRSIVAAHRRPELWVVGIAEVGLVVAIREVIASVIMKTTFDLVLASIATVCLAVALWVLSKSFGYRATG